MKRLFAIPVLFCSLRALGAAPFQPIHVSVKFDSSFYELNYDTTAMTYKEGARSYTLKVKGCSRSKISKIAERYRALKNEYASHRPYPKTQFDVQITMEGGDKIAVARGSSFGTWLREFPKQIMYYDAEVQVLCKR